MCLCRRKIWPRSRFESDTGCEETSVWSTCELLKKGQSVSDMEKATFLFPHTLEDTATTTSSSAPASSARRRPGPGQRGDGELALQGGVVPPGRAGAGMPDPRRVRAREHPTAIPHQDARPRRGALVMSDRRTAPRTRRARSGTSPTMPASRAGDVRHQGARGGGGERIPGARRRPRGAPGSTVLSGPGVDEYRPPLVPVSRWIGLVWPRSSDDSVVPVLVLQGQAGSRPGGSWTPC